MGDPLTKQQIEAQKVRYESQLDILRKASSRRKRAADSEKKCKEALSELDALKRENSQKQMSKCTLFQISTLQASILNVAWQTSEER